MHWNLLQSLCGPHCRNCQHCTESCKNAQMTRTLSLAENTLVPHRWECQNGTENGLAHPNIPCLGEKLSLRIYHVETSRLPSLFSSHNVACWNYWALCMYWSGRLHCVSSLLSRVTCNDCSKPIQQYPYVHLTLWEMNIHPNGSCKCTSWISNFPTAGLLTQSSGSPSSPRPLPSPAISPHRSLCHHRQRWNTTKLPLPSQTFEPLASGDHFTICACHPDNWATGHANLLSIVSSANWRPDYLQAYTWVHWLNSDNICIYPIPIHIPWLNRH